MGSVVSHYREEVARCMLESVTNSELTRSQFLSETWDCLASCKKGYMENRVTIHVGQSLLQVRI